MYSIDEFQPEKINDNSFTGDIQKISSYTVCSSFEKRFCISVEKD